MALPLFWRLTLGYAAILLLSVGASLYAIVQLGELSQTARVALDTDYRTIAQQESLTDAFLSEVRYGGKYLLTQSPSSYDQFRQFKNDFLRYLSELKTAATAAETSTQLVRVEHLHQSFHDLFEQEARHIKTGQPYAQSRYQQERTKILDNTLRELAGLKDQLEKNIQHKLERLGGTARAARNIAIATTLLLLVLGTMLSLKISTSVTKPLLELTTRCKDESANDPALAQFSSIPEIQELSEVLMRQKRRLLRAAENNASDMERLTEELAARLTSCKKQLNELKAKHDPVLSSPGRASIDPIIEDTDRLIQHCAELNAAAAARTEVMKLAPQSAQELNAAASSLATNAWLMRELPDAQAGTQCAVKPLAARRANLFAPLLRQLRRHKSDTA